MVSAKDVPPGGAGEIKATFKTKGYRGAVAKTITVETNDPENKQVRLSLTGKVVPDVRVEPRILNFGIVGRETPRQPIALRIALAPIEDLRITQVKSESDVFVLTKQSEDPEKRESLYSITLAGKLPVGRLKGRIVIQTTSKSMPEVRILASVVVQGEVAASPRALSLGALRTGEQTTRELILMKTGSTPFTVEKILPTSPDLSASVVLEKQGERYRVLVTYDPKKRAEGRILERLTIYVNAHGEEILEIPVYGTFQPEAAAGPGPLQ